MRLTLALCLAALLAGHAAAHHNDDFRQSPGNEALKTNPNRDQSRWNKGWGAPGTAPEALTDWGVARATYYGDGDGYNINQGSCHFGNIWGPYYVAAVSDVGNDWFDDRCGRCYEIACSPGETRGVKGFSRFPDGEDGCKEGNKSVVVVITDSCPCNHANPNNQIWCCGDKLHFDLSWAAFDVIAKRHKGVVDVAFRRVRCNDAMRTYGRAQVAPEVRSMMRDGARGLLSVPPVDPTSPAEDVADPEDTPPSSPSEPPVAPPRRLGPTGEVP